MSESENSAVELARILDSATDLLGSREAAERWLSSPAMSLDQCTPIEVLQTPGGVDIVKTLLTRMDFGTYS